MPEDFEEGDSTEVFMNQYSSEHDGILITDVAGNSSKRRNNITQWLKKMEHKAQKTNSFFGE